MNPLCPKCEIRKCEWRGDRQKFRPTCKRCRVPSSNAERRFRRKGRAVSRPHMANYLKLSFQKKDCELCGFVAVHPCQLDVDHKDGNRLNDDLNNLQVLCANCHRLKTFVSEDWLPRDKDVIAA